jgi:hypothetical protein
MRLRTLLLALAAAGAAGCAPDPHVLGGGDGGGFAVSGCDPDAAPTRFISCVLSYEPGPGDGHGQVASNGEAGFPQIVYGPPVGGGTAAGSTDVLTLGGGGEIAFGFGGNAIVDGPGVDFILFENPFDIGGDPTDPYDEPGVVSVSEDAVTWVDFPCQKDTYPYTGCAGWRPVISNPDNGISPFDPATAGGDPFDLADIGVARARYVRVRDVSFRGASPTEGFDLDAAAIVNAEAP